MDEQILARLDRVESLQAIQQLPIRYAIAVDSRDLDAWVSLFVEDVDCRRYGVGRAALRGMIAESLKTFYRSIHQICGHKVDFVDADNATGQVYCRAEHEDQGRWVVMAICYFDTYQRRDGRWYFVHRKERHWYAHDVEERPQPPFDNWPGRSKPPTLPQAFATWPAFWRGVDQGQVEQATAAPVHGPAA